MRFQFSLATLLVCLTVLAVVCAAMKIQVQEQSTVIEADGIHKAPAIVEVSRSPNTREIACRLVIWGPIAVCRRTL